MALEIAHDGAVIWSTLARPGYGFARAVSRHRALSAIVISVALSLLATALILPHIDTEAIAGEQLSPDMTPHEREQAIDAASKLFQVTTWASATATPIALALFVTIALWLAFRVAGAPTGFKSTFTVAAHALIPLSIKTLLTVPAVIVRHTVTPVQIPTFLPSNLGFVFSPPNPLLAAAIASVDLFTVWSLVLLGIGMRKATGASRLRTVAVMFILFASYVALAKIAPAAGGH